MLTDYGYHRVTIGALDHGVGPVWVPSVVMMAEGVPEGKGTEKGSLCGTHDMIRLFIIQKVVDR